jgi:hypothetical protein
LCKEQDSSVLSRDAAIAAVRNTRPAARGASVLAAYFGIIQAEVLAEGPDVEHLKPLLWDRLVWIIQFDRQWYPHGGQKHARMREQGLIPKGPFPGYHVIDARTGEHLQMFGAGKPDIE